jgi:DNA-damage-inducible protein D
MTCEKSGENPEDHFRETTKMIEVGKGARRAHVDYFLDRYACYLIAMSGDAKKVEIATIIYRSIKQVILVAGQLAG